MLLEVSEMLDPWKRKFEVTTFNTQLIHVLLSNMNTTYFCFILIYTDDKLFHASEFYEINAIMIKMLSYSLTHSIIETTENYIHPGS